MQRPSNGVILWQGASLIDGKTPVVAIMTGLFGSRSSNRKTGAMVQTYIIRADVSPVDAVRDRTDGGICGGCVHRKQANGRRTCYVNVGQGPSAVYKAFRRGRYATTDLATAANYVRGQFVRFGTYGDPAAVPADIWAALAAAASGTTGYTHQWRSGRFAALGQLMQASCETADDVAAAHAKGYAGTFRVIPIGADVPAGALHCPASEEQGKRVQCIDCRACNGTRDVVIYAHGPSKAYYAGGRALPVLAA
jgi:hypothetical protein